MPHDKRPTTDSAPPLALEQLAQGIERVEAALVVLEQLVDAHCRGAQLTTHAAAEAAVHAFTGAWQSVSAQALQFSAQMTTSDKIFAATRPIMYPHAAARRISDVVGELLFEHSNAARACLLYLQSAAARAQLAVARLAAADRALKETHHG